MSDSLLSPSAPASTSSSEECLHTDVERIWYLQKTSQRTPTQSDEILADHLSYPFCIVFIPFPILSWLLPFMGHYGIGMSDGSIRDFSGNYQIGIHTVSFGIPTKYCRLDPFQARGGVRGWDQGIAYATNEYLKRHGKPVSKAKKRNPSYVAESLNAMQYGDCTRWNRCRLLLLMTRQGHYTSFSGFLRTWLPFSILVSVCGMLLFVMWTVESISY